MVYYSDMPSESLVTVHTAMLADYAKVDRGGLLNIVGGGATKISVPSLPSAHNFGIAVQVSSATATPTSEPMSIQLTRPDGTPAIRINAEVNVTPGSEVSNLAFNLNTIVDVEGRWTISLAIGSEEPQVELQFDVELPAGR